MNYLARTAGVVVLAGLLGGCGVVAGGAAAGGYYEWQNRQALEELEAQYEAGEISREEYERRREEIRRRSVVY